MTPKPALCLKTRLIGTLLILSSVGGQTATAATATSRAEALYRQERAVCLSGRSNQDRATCLKEAGAALAEARRSPPSAADDPGSLRDNALRRCQAHTTPEERERCARMADGAGSSSGSVSDGGVVKELVTREPAPR